MKLRLTYGLVLIGLAITLPAQVGTFGFSKAVTIPGTPVTLSSGRQLVRWALVQALATNTGIICVGGADVSCALSKGVRLTAGQSIPLSSFGEDKDINRYDLFQTYMDASIGGEGVQVTYAQNTLLSTPPVFGIPPVLVSLTTPSNGSTFAFADPIALTAVASQAGATINRVEFYDGVVLLNTDNTAPFTYNWTSATSGIHSLTARAFTSSGAGVSTIVGVTVSTSSVIVSMTSPTSSSTVISPAAITLTATATQSGGTITSVEFYDGLTLLNTDAVSPYTYNWTSAAIGSHSLTAKAYGTSASATSAVVTVVVESAITVSMVSPVNGDSFMLPATITMSAVASQSGGSISKVEFYDGALLVNTDTADPFTFAWGTATAGSHILTAKAYNASMTASTTSASVIISASDPACIIDYTDALVSHAEPAPPTVPLNGSYTSFCTKVYRLSDPTSTGTERWLSPDYVNRTPLSLNNAHMIVVDHVGIWFFIPITWTGSAPNEVPTGGAFAQILVGGAGKPATMAKGLWSPIDSNKYCAVDKFKLWCINPTTMTWTMTKDFESFIPDMTSFLAVPDPPPPAPPAVNCAPYTTAAANFILSGWTDDGNKMLFGLHVDSKVLYGVLEYTVSTNTVRINVGKTVNNKDPFYAGRLQSVEWDKAGNYLIYQEGAVSNCPADAHQYVVAAGASNLLGVAGTPSYSLHGDIIVGHGMTLPNGHVAYTNDINGWRFVTPSEYTRGLRLVDLTSTPPGTAPFLYANTIPFAWPYGNTINGYHMSVNTISSRRWAIMSVYQDTYLPRIANRLSNEIVAIDTTANMTISFGQNPTGANIRRLGHHFSWPGNDLNKPPGAANTYALQPHASLSYDGKFAVFGSSMGNQQKLSVFLMVLPASVRP